MAPGSSGYARRPCSQQHGSASPTALLATAFPLPGPQAAAKAHGSLAPTAIAKQHRPLSKQCRSRPLARRWSL
eukprot:6595904-Alexandrium_andersonii.AAC.1